MVVKFTPNIFLTKMVLFKNVWNDSNRPNMVKLTPIEKNITYKSSENQKLK